MIPATLIPATMLWILIISLALLAVWEIWICEGAHLGRRFVVWTYDFAAPRYDRIKGFDPEWEQRLLGEPVRSQLKQLESPKLLDVGAGTGRLARSLTPLGELPGFMVNAEPSRRMAALGKSRTNERIPWIRAWASALPFPTRCFEMLCCLEVLEFTPDPSATLDELCRVLRPGGWLLITNRVSREAPLILGKTIRRERFPTFIAEHGFQEIELYPWQLDYDLLWARKSWDPPV